MSSTQSVGALAHFSVFFISNDYCFVTLLVSVVVSFVSYDVMSFYWLHFYLHISFHCVCYGYLFCCFVLLFT